MFLHLIARLSFGQRLLESPQSARWMMRCLRRAWPEALAACVMPSHFHVVAATESIAAERVRLRRVAAAFSKHLAGIHLWEPIPEPSRITDSRHLLRTVRYVVLNPCRSGLVSDPLCWPYSTLRSVIGAEYDPWVSASDLAQALGHPRQFREWFHRYVTADSELPPEARIFPRPALPSDVPVVSLGDVLKSAESATPHSSDRTRRVAFVVLARSQGWHTTAALARASGLSERQVRRLARICSPQLLEAAALCLGDARLRVALSPRYQSGH
jgi:hypothetical protein